MASRVFELLKKRHRAECRTQKPTPERHSSMESSQCIYGDYADVRVSIVCMIATQANRLAN